MIAGKLLIVGVASGKLLAIDKDNGVLEWSTDVSAPKGKSETQRMNDISAEPVVDGGKIYAISYQGKLSAIDLATVNIVFDKDLSSFSGLTISNGKIYVATTDGDVYALDKATGHTIWHQTDLQGRWLTKPVVYKNYILIGDDEGFLHLVSRENGELINRYKLDSSGIVAAPLVNDDQVFVLEQSGKFASLCIN
jgi:outer membrane protein assembly factor BamB